MTSNIFCKEANIEPLDMAEQQRLFDHYNPIEKRLGKEFFSELPKEAGVYKMYDQKKKLLYVGKAKDLRNRLFTYRRAKMGSTSRKTVRLIRMTHDVEYEICESEKEALLLENKLIREHQPEFNHAKKQPETYYYIGVKQLDDQCEFSLQMHIPEKEKVFGAFKGHRLVRKTMGGLLRIFYLLEHDINTPFGLPSVLIRNLTPMKYKFPLATDSLVEQSLWSLLMDYLQGKNRQLIDVILDICEDRELIESFAGSMILDDLDSIKWFYERCSHRNYQICHELDLDSAIIPQDKLDNYLVEWAFSKDQKAGPSS